MQQNPVTATTPQQSAMLIPRSVNSLNKGGCIRVHSLVDMVRYNNYLIRERHDELFDLLDNTAKLTLIILMGEIQHRILTMRTELEKAGLYRHQVKKLTRKMADIANSIQKDVIRLGELSSTQFCNAVLPGCGEQYIAEGSNVITTAQMEFSQMIANDISLFYISGKQALDDIHYPNSAPCAHALLTLGIAELFLSVSDNLHTIIHNRTGRKPLLINTKDVETVRSTANELIAVLVRSEVPKESGEHARTILNRMTSVVIGDRMAEVIHKSEQRMQFEYIEYFLATLATYLHNETRIPFSMLRSMMFKLREKKRVIQLLNDIKEVTTSLFSDSADVFELSLEIHSAGSKAIDEFRYLAMNDKRRYTEAEIRKVSINILRNEIKENNGLLPLGSLKQLYSEYHTKKAMEQLFTDMGADGKATLKVLRKMRVCELDMNN